ncbi:unnamed protein product [Cochlearia groenlandica]
MATLDSPLEALAFEYASFGVFAVVNNVWTWIAVVTAAVSFWRIRFTTTVVVVDSSGCGLLEELTDSKSYKSNLTEEIKPELKTGSVEQTVAKTEIVTDVCEPLVYGGGVTKGKMTVYYEVNVDGRGKCVDGELTDVNYEGGLGGCGGEWWETWESVMRMRNGDDSWYRYVDLTVFNGNVVRLWDDDNVIRNGGKCD